MQDFLVRKFAFQGIKNIKGIRRYAHLCAHECESFPYAAKFMRIFNFWKLKVMRGPIVLEKYNWKGAHFLWKYQHIGEKGDGWPLIGEVRTWWQEEKAKANLGIGPLGSPVSSNDSLFIKGIFSYSTVELWGVTMWTLQNIATAEMSQAITSLTIFTCLSIVSR